MIMELEVAGCVVTMPESQRGFELSARIPRRPGRAHPRRLQCVECCQEGRCAGPCLEGVGRHSPLPQLMNYLKTEFRSDREQSVFDYKGLASNLSAAQLFCFLRISRALASQAPIIQTRDRLLLGWLSDLFSKSQKSVSPPQ